MKLRIPKALPQAHEVVAMLNEKFAGRCRFSLFGIGPNKTIMARKSALVGLQLSIDDEEISFTRTMPTVAGSAVHFLALTELIALILIPVLFITEGFRRDPYKELAKEIGAVLKQEYN